MRTGPASTQAGCSDIGCGRTSPHEFETPHTATNAAHDSTTINRPGNRIRLHHWMVNIED